MTGDVSHFHFLFCPLCGSVLDSDSFKGIALDYVHIRCGDCSSVLGLQVFRGMAPLGRGGSLPGGAPDRRTRSPV